MSKIGFAQHDAGVLKDDKLSPGAKDKFIKDVKELMVLGDAGLPPFPMPCGPELPPVPFADTIELEDEEQYPEFHKHWLGTYEQIAKALDLQSQFMFAPIVMDPIALAAKLQLDIPTLNFPDDFILFGTALPLLAIKLGFDLPVELAAKLPSILIPTPPIPDVPLPVDIDVELFPDLALHLGWPLKLPGMFADLIVQMPSLFVGLLQLDFKPICDVVLNSGLFGTFRDGSTVQVAAAKVLARKTAECTLIAMVGGSVGSSSGGITGAMGKEFGYIPPPPPATIDQNPRDRIVSAALKLDGKSWSSDKKSLKSGTSLEQASLPYTEWILPIMSTDNKKRAFNRASGFSSCGLFVRGCYFRGGATDAYFTREYRDSTAISGLLDVAKRKGATIPFSRNNMPALKKGDAILVQRRGEPGSEHVLMVTENYGGGFDGSVAGIEGGQVDKDNKGKPTAVKSTRYRFFKSGGTIRAGKNKSDGREILRIFDAEKMVQND